jgi:hypothetical protein
MIRAGHCPERLKVTFSIQRNDNLACYADVKIFNLSTETQNKILSQEFSRIVIIAGYDGLDVSQSDAMCQPVK